MIVLGIDPGTQRMGYGLVRMEGGKTEYLSAGVFRVRAKDAAGILPDLKSELVRLIRKWRPEAFGIEKIFLVRNQKTGLAVAEARGVAVLVASEEGLPILEFSPNEVKLGLTGDGSADKRAICKMVRLVLREPELELLDDAADALAIAICAGQRAAFRKKSGD